MNDSHFVGSVEGFSSRSSSSSSSSSRISPFAAGCGDAALAALAAAAIVSMSDLQFRLRLPDLMVKFHNDRCDLRFSVVARPSLPVMLATLSLLAGAIFRTRRAGRAGAFGGLVVPPGGVWGRMGDSARGWRAAPAFLEKSDFRAVDRGGFLAVKVDCNNGFVPHSGLPRSVKGVVTSRAVASVTVVLKPQAPSLVAASSTVDTAAPSTASTTSCGSTPARAAGAETTTRRTEQQLGKLVTVVSSVIPHSSSRLSLYNSISRTSLRVLAAPISAKRSANIIGDSRGGIFSYPTTPPSPLSTSPP
mmetsp:Transcript_9146/g.27689  ORF Transcript_9146/g.27689 Transcript_9146/m.27689 type:complete len:304 (+) Transcript_9146:2879-3790(+)